MPEDLSVSTATGSFARRQAERLLGNLAVQIARTIRAGAPAEVHALRVAIRRFTRVLVALKPCFPGSESKKIRRALKRIMEQAGNVRDRDIALRLLARFIPAASAPLVRQLRAEREEAARLLAMSLKRWVRRNSSARWRSALAVEGAAGTFAANPVEVNAARILPRMAKRYFRCGKAAANGKAPAEDLHEFRIAAKNLRYTLDLFAPLYGASVNGLLQQLKGVQAFLGGINDCAAVRRMVARHEGGREILAALKKRQRKKTAQFRRHWTAAFSSAAAVRRWTGNLRHACPRTPIARKPPGRSAATAPAMARSAGA